MLQIFDINTDSKNLQEVEDLKQDFRNFLSPNVHNATVVIVSNFPSVGNFTGIITYLIFLVIFKNGGSLRIRKEGKNCNIDSLVCLIKRIQDNDVIKSDDECIYDSDGEFNYIKSIKNNLYEFQDFCDYYAKIRPSLIYQILSSNEINFSNPFLLINEKLKASNIIENSAIQFVEKFGYDYRVNSFDRDFWKILNHDSLISLIKDIVNETNERFKNGILTKKKLDKISTSNKTVNNIYNNVGKSLSVIKGKAGTGKTLTLLRIMFMQAESNQKVRFLTFNNLLIFDIKQSLRNFNFYGDSNISLRTVHRFFFDLSEKLGIRLIMNESRIIELLEICKQRIYKLRKYVHDYSNEKYFIRSDDFLHSLPSNLKNEADYQEFIEFSKFLSCQKNLSNFDEIAESYLNWKRSILFSSVGSKTFIEDYYKYLENIYQAVSDSGKFYDDFDIKNRYELLSILYKTDTYHEKVNEIPYENFLRQVKSLKRNTNWSKLLIIDECQDFHVYEKEILYFSRGSENIVVSSGGKEQLVRHSKLLDWSVSFGKKVSHLPFNLSGGSYRQKQNIVDFVNKFSNFYGIDINLKSVTESNGLGKIIIDTREKNTFIKSDIALDLKNAGEVNGCSQYESVLFLIPSKNYTRKQKSTGFIINDTDYVTTMNVTTGRETLDLNELSEMGYLLWDGVSENKGKLKPPYQNECRIIHFESCRGIESWSVACLSLDEYFKYKRATKEAESHLSDDLFYTEDQRRDKYAVLWCIMAFTRPIDTS